MSIWEERCETLKREICRITSYCMHYMVLHVAEHPFCISTVPIGVYGQDMMSSTRGHLSTIILTWQEKENANDTASM